jgi:hypothetical protein
MALCSAVGIFGVTHMGGIETSGPEAEAFLQRIGAAKKSVIDPHGMVPEEAQDPRVRLDAHPLASPPKMCHAEGRREAPVCGRTRTAIR